MPKRRTKRYRVIAQDHIMSYLGQTSFTKKQAQEMIRDLRNRGYGEPRLDPVKDS
jgi:hypothetical protein